MTKFDMGRKATLRILEDEQISLIHENALDFLENTGVRFESDRALAFLKESGCTVDDEARMVRFPRGLVLQALESAPEQFDMYNAAGEKCLEFGKGNSYFVPGPGAVSIVDADGTRRFGSMQDLSEQIQIAQKSPLMRMVGETIVPFDAEGPSDLYMLHQAMKHSSVPIVGEAFSPESLNRICEIIEDFCGSKEVFAEKPFLWLSSTPEPPLCWGSTSVDIAWKCVEYGIPLLICSCPIMGVTSPITFAGGILHHTIEELAFITFVQLLHPGAKVLYGCFCGTMDMRSSYVAYSAGESGLCVAGIADLAHYYGIPCATFFAQSEAKLPDYQAGFETCFGALISRLSGFDIIFGAGTLDAYGCTSSVKTAIDAQLFNFVEMFASGIQIDEETLGREEIEEVLCGEGETYLERLHTAEWMRESQFYGNSILDRSSLEVWEAQGKDIIQRAQGEIESLCADPYQVDEELAARIDAAFAKSF